MTKKDVALARIRIFASTARSESQYRRSPPKNRRNRPQMMALQCENSTTGFCRRVSHSVQDCGQESRRSRVARADEKPNRNDSTECISHQKQYLMPKKKKNDSNYHGPKEGRWISGYWFFGRYLVEAIQQGPSKSISGLAFVEKTLDPTVTATHYDPRPDVAR